jgi:hypothetical protein
MSSTGAFTKPLSEKQQLKLENFAKKKEKQAQQQQLNGVLKESKLKNPEALSVDSNDWADETPAGQKKAPEATGR